MSQAPRHSAPLHSGRGLSYLGFAVVVSEFYGPASGHIRGIGRGLLEKAIFLTLPCMKRDVLFLGARLAEYYFTHQLIALRIRAEAILVTRHAYIQTRTGDGDLGWGMGRSTRTRISTEHERAVCAACVRVGRHL